MADFNQLKTAIAEVIRQNGNEEITGDVLQFVLLEMVTALGSGYRFAGVATPTTQPQEPDGAVFYIGAQGEYQNFTGATVTVPEGAFCIFMWNGSWVARTIGVTRPVDDTLTEGGQNPVEGGVIYAEFEKLRDAGYLFAGVAQPPSAPPQDLSEKVFYVATAGGQYPNFGTGFTLPEGLNFLLFDGEAWSVTTLLQVTADVESESNKLLTSGGAYAALQLKVDKEAGKGLSDENYTQLEKVKLGELPTAAQLAELLSQKQNVLTFDLTPLESSTNPVTSGGVYDAIKDFITKATDDLINYYLKSETYSKVEVNTLLAAVKQFRYELVPVLPEASIDTMGIIYFVPADDPKQQNIKDEYITLTRSEGGTTEYYWEQIGSTAIDLSGYSTTEEMNAAIATALEAYYTKVQTDALLAAAKGLLCDVTITTTKDTVKVGEATSLTVQVATAVNASEIILKRDGVVVAQGAGAGLNFADVLTADVAGTVKYVAMLTIGGTERTVEVDVVAVNAVLVGVALSVADVVTEVSARRTPAGRYQVTAAEAESYLFVLVPMSMTVSGVDMSGLALPMEAPTGVVVGDLAYKCYQSSNTYDAGTYDIEVY